MQYARQREARQQYLNQRGFFGRTLDKIVSFVRRAAK